MKRSILLAGAFAATILVAACGSTETETTGAAASPTTETTTQTTPATTDTPTSSATAEASDTVSAQTSDPDNFSGYRQTCLEAMTAIDEFDKWNKQWNPDAPDIDAHGFVEELLANAPNEPDFQALSADEQEQFIRAYRAAATGRC